MEVPFPNMLNIKYRNSTSFALVWICSLFSWEAWNVAYVVHSGYSKDCPVFRRDLSVTLKTKFQPRACAGRRILGVEVQISRWQSWETLLCTLSTTFQIFLVGNKLESIFLSLGKTKKIPINARLWCVRLKVPFYVGLAICFIYMHTVNRFWIYNLVCNFVLMESLMVLLQVWMLTRLQWKALWNRWWWLQGTQMPPWCHVCRCCKWIHLHLSSRI